MNYHTFMMNRLLRLIYVFDSMQYPQLIILCGLPGVGKTTDISNHIDDNWFCYSTDSYLDMVANLNGSDYDTVFDANIKHAVKYMDSRLLTAFKEGKNVAWDQTNLSKKKRKAILSKFPVYYHTACWYYPLYDNHYFDWINRLANRPGKTIPPKVLASMVEHMECPDDTEGFDEIVIKDIWNANY